MAATSSGFVVVWDDYEDVFARRFDTAGAPLGDPFQVNTATFGFQGSADVAATADGGFVVAWEDGNFDAPGEDGSGYGVFARRYDAVGNASGMQFQVNTTTAGDQYSVAVTAPPSGGFIVVWQSFDPDAVSQDAAVLGQRFDGGGATMGSEFRANAAPSDEADHPQVASDQFGNFVVVWSAPNALGASTTVMERRFEGAGTPLAGPTPVNVLPTPAPAGSARCRASQSSAPHPTAATSSPGSARTAMCPRRRSSRSASPPSIRRRSRRRRSPARRSRPSPPPSP